MARCAALPKDLKASIRYNRSANRPLFTGNPVGKSEWNLKTEYYT
jgi:hypothetical protein